MRILLVVMALALISLSCKSTKTDKAVNEATVSEDFSLYLERTACFGNCPQYTLTVNATGKVSYNGIRSVDFVGEYEKKLSKKKVKELVFLIDSHEFWKFNETYNNDNITDLPSFITQCTHKGKTHKVLARANVPANVTELQNLLETAVGLEGFTKVTD